MRHMRSRRILAMLLALSMIFGLLTTTAFAGEVDQNTSNVGESAANGTSEGGSGEGQSSGASEDESSKATNKEDVPTEEETNPEQKKTTSSEEVDTQEGEGKTPVEETTYVASIGEQGYASLDAAIQAAQDNDTIVVSAGEYTLNGSLTYNGKAFTIKAADNEAVSFDMSAAVALHGAKITFEGVTFDYKTNGNYIGLQHTDTLVYDNCVINGTVFLYATNETFNGCTFNQTSADAYNVWTYGAKNVAFNNCTFYCVGKSVLVYNEGAIAKTDLNVNDTTFNASAPVKGKAAIEIDTSLMTEGATITVDANTTADGFAAGSNSGSTLWNDKKQTADTNKNTTVTVAGETAFAPKSESSDAIVDEKTLRKALFDAPTNGKQITIKLENDITLDMLYAAENFDEEKLEDNAAGDTFNRYKQGVHPTPEDPNNWNPLVTNQTQDERVVYGAYYHMSATDERIARLVVKAGQNIVLDLNGHTIQKNPRATHGDWSTTCTDILANYGTLTITDTSTGAEGTIKGNGYISCQGAVLHNYAGASMTVGAINVDGNAAGMSAGYPTTSAGATSSLRPPFS